MRKILLKCESLGRLLERSTCASARKEGVHGGTRGSPVKRSVSDRDAA
jgi:hypothetical protein